MLQVGPVLVILGKTPVEVHRRRRAVALGERGPGRLTGRRMLVVAGVEQIDRPPGQEPPLLPALRHPAPHRPHPAAPAQPVQHPTDAPLVHPQDGHQVGNADQGHQPRYPEQTHLFVAHRYTGRHMGTSPAYAANPCIESLSAYGAAWEFQWVTRFLGPMPAATGYGAAIVPAETVGRSGNPVRRVGTVIPATPRRRYQLLRRLHWARLTADAAGADFGTGPPSR